MPLHLLIHLFRCIHKLLCIFLPNYSYFVPNLLLTLLFTSRHYYSSSLHFRSSFTSLCCLFFFPCSLPFLLFYHSLPIPFSYMAPIHSHSNGDHTTISTLGLRLLSSCRCSLPIHVPILKHSSIVPSCQIA